MALVEHSEHQLWCTATRPRWSRCGQRGVVHLSEWRPLTETQLGAIDYLKSGVASATSSGAAGAGAATSSRGDLRGKLDALRGRLGVGTGRDDGALDSGPGALVSGVGAGAKRRHSRVAEALARQSLGLLMCRIQVSRDKRA